MDSHSERKGLKYVAVSALAALGVVFGDIGTSPLYALKECFSPHTAMVAHGAAGPAASDVLGIVSLILWTIIAIVSVKYVVFVMRADHKGEGGIMALVSLAGEGASESKRRVVLLLLGIFGAALLYGDGIITPAISVLSAVEGLREVDAVKHHIGDGVVVSITIAILIGLFAFQRFGTAGVARIFGPVMLLWFTALGLLGLRGLYVYGPGVIAAFNPVHGARFLVDHVSNGHGASVLAVMGSVFLAVTGAEALYADMGHFGLRPIRAGWWVMVMPCLMLNYLGQGSMLMASPEAHTNPFFKLAPEWASVPLVLLATAATVIASQALITGAYSITMQAIQLGYLPRIRILHTSKHERGQIYMPAVNWFLMIACIGLVLQFRNSGALAAAYGIAVTLTMLITTFLFYSIARRRWGWSTAKTSLVCAPFLLVEGVFAFANLLKFMDGGWFPILVGLAIFTLMTTWKKGRSILREKLAAALLPLDAFVSDVKNSKVTRVSGTAVFMSGNVHATPLALLHNLKHNKVLHKRVIFLSVVTETVPHVEKERRASVEDLGEGCWRIVGRYGYMEEPDVQEVLEITKTVGFECPMTQCTFFLSRETIIAGSAMPVWRSKIFSLLSKNALPATAFFRLPPNRVIELGMQIEC